MGTRPLSVGGVSEGWSAPNSAAFNRILGLILVLQKPSMAAMRHRTRMSLLRMRSEEARSAADAALLRAIADVVLHLLERPASGLPAAADEHRATRGSAQSASPSHR
jgi:hypothetical protein